uniref:Ubiquitin carboxyl-terminal hydrolase n=1 Tax=Echeneis naucrates TaxID=173247 RepID=A0A665VDM0_ECHNA
MLINQLREITGVQDPQILYTALNASQGDIGHAVGLLTTQPAEVQGPGEPRDSGTSEEAWEGQKGIRKDELQTAIELSLQESHKAQEEEREFHRALEASAEENAARMKRKRCEAQTEMCSPADWIRQDEWPVGIRNVGNTCWFSAVIQSLFHLPVFRRLVLNYHLSDLCSQDKRNIAFMQELRCLFALMVGSTRRFVDPSAAVELLRDAFRTSEAQQDVSEFSHKLLDWLEDAFQLAASGNNAEDKQQNPMVQLFYGTFVTERRHEGKTLCNTEQFGQYPLQVNGFNNLDECLEGAMVEKEIESLHSDQGNTPGRERWFKKLPPVLTFELSRFEFNTQLGRPEKIHKKLEFPQIIYMDRYLHKNIEQTQERRGEVKKVKEQLAVLQQKFECYKNYGSGPTKYPLADMLQFVLEFATTKPTSVSPAEDPRLAASSPTPAGHPLSELSKENSSPADTDSSDGLAPSVSTCQRTPIYKPFTQCRHPIDCPPHPAPHSITEEELHFVKTCLQRWRTEVENDINELKASIDRLSQKLEGMYSDNSLCQVPYRLHAVLVHEGQASAGHYWAYIYDHTNQRWMKYNDISITESSWEELERDSFGGMTNASAYCLMYIDDRLPHLITEDTDDETGQVLHGMDSLPSILRRYVHEDNRWFQQELSEWEEQFCQTATPQGESTASAEPPNPGPDNVQQTPVEPAPQSGLSAEEVDQAAASEPQPDPEAEKDPEPDLRSEAFHEEYSRLYELSQEEATPQEDARLQHALVYFFKNKAPKRIIERTLLEQFTDRNLSFDERAISIMREARAKLCLIKPEDMDMDEYLVLSQSTRLPQLTIISMFWEALNYLAHAYETNGTLLKNGEKRGVDKSLIAVYRRKCLSALNESASRLFCSGEENKVEEAVAIMDEAVIPCLHLMSRDSALSQEDRDAMEGIRSHWCCCLGQDMNDSLQVKLGELLPRVLDGSAETVVLKDPPKVHVNQAHDLCSRLAAVMESIHNTSIVIVK